MREILIVRLPQPSKGLLVVANKVISEKSLHNSLKRKINKKINVCNQPTLILGKDLH